MAPVTRSQKRLQPSAPPDERSPKRFCPSDTKIPLSELVKDKELWFFDGNIVLAAGNACFKVHRSQLARFCAVFEDMFGAPGPNVNEEMIEDCVVVRMPDAAADLANFLQAIYNAHSFDFTTTAANFPAAAGVMRLATKYDCPVFRTRIWASLQKECPPSLDSAFLSTSGYSTTRTVKIILLAYECGLDDLLPPCLYRLAFDTRRHDYIKQFMEYDQQRLKRGRNAVLKRVRRFAEKGRPILSNFCPSRRNNNKFGQTRCERYLEDYWKYFIAPRGRMDNDLAEEPLRTLYDLTFYSVLGKAKGDVCSNCWHGLMNHLRSMITSIKSNVTNDFML